MISKLKNNQMRVKRKKSDSDARNKQPQPSAVITARRMTAGAGKEFWVV